MQHVSSINPIKSGNQPLSTSQNPPTQLQETTSSQQTITVIKSNQNVIAHFWRAMTQIYGMQWISSYGEKASKAWTQELEKLTPEEIKSGIDLSIHSDSQFPPNLPLFLTYCKTLSDCKRRSVETQKLLSRSRWQGNDSVRDAELSKIHALLGMRKQMPREDSEKRRIEILKNAENYMKQQGETV